MKKIILALAIVIATVSVAAADTFYLRDGRTVHGTLLGFVNGRFVVRVENRYSTANPDSNVQRNRDNQGDLQYFRPEEIDRIEIVWPSGAHQVLQNVKPDQVLTVRESSSAGENGGRR